MVIPFGKIVRKKLIKRVTIGGRKSGRDRGGGKRARFRNWHMEIPGLLPDRLFASQKTSEKAYKNTSAYQDFRKRILLRKIRGEIFALVTRYTPN